MSRTREILLVEDSPSDAFLTREALRGLGPRLHVVNDGVEAMQFLRREPPFNQFREAIRLIETFWFHLASLPPGEAPR